MKISGEVSLIQWLIFTYQAPHCATCQSHVVPIKISQLKYPIHVLHNSNLSDATPVADTSLGRCLLWLAAHFRAVGCNARGDPFHSAVVPASLAPFHPVSSNARAMHSTRALAYQLLLSCSAEGSNARGTCPLGRWAPPIHISDFGMLQLYPS